MPNKDTTFEVTVRLFDLDINNHVNNSVYFTYMEEARTKLLLDQYLNCKENGINFIVVEATCKYKKPIMGLLEKVSVEIEVQNIKTVSFDLLYTFKSQSGDIYAKGKTKMACVNSESHKPVRIPEDITEFLKEVQ